MQRLLVRAGRDHAAHAGFLGRPLARWVSDDAPRGKEGIISIDRSGLYRMEDQEPGVDKEPETPMARHLKALIRFRNGPITLAEYMSEVLTNPTAGYYITRDMIGIWCVSTWMQLGSPPALRIVELGPGRGTLMADLLRGTSAFRNFASALKVDMVEVSPTLRGLQARALGCELQPGQDAAPSRLLGGAEVNWHRSLDAVPDDRPTLFIAHEFVDALPVHQFQKTERGWCERLVDIASPDSPLHLRLVLSPSPTPAARLLVPRRLGTMEPEEAECITELEVCPQGMVLAETLARRIGKSGGAALIMDYGRDAAYGSSLAAIRAHAFRPLLEAPGSADLSARVDFSALRAAATGMGCGVAAWGPLTQASFLLGLGMGTRLEALLQSAADERQAEELVAGFHRLVGLGQAETAMLEAAKASEALGAGAEQHSNEGQNPGPSSESLAADKRGADNTAHSQQDGMGVTYKALCLAPEGMTPPAPFDFLQGKGMG